MERSRSGAFQCLLKRPAIVYGPNTSEGRSLNLTADDVSINVRRNCPGSSRPGDDASVSILPPRSKIMLHGGLLRSIASYSDPSPVA